MRVTSVTLDTAIIVFDVFGSDMYVCMYVSNKVAIFYAEGSAVALHPEFGRAPEDPTGMSH